MNETQHIEWKQSWRDEALRGICGFANAEDGVMVIERLDEKLGENRAAIVRVMRKNPRITVSEVAQALQISRTAADKNIQVLKAKGYIKRVGSAKGGHWVVLK